MFGSMADKRLRNTEHKGNESEVQEAFEEVTRIRSD